jgi:hypothetical protein
MLGTFNRIAAIALGVFAFTSPLSAVPLLQASLSLSRSDGVNPPSIWSQSPTLSNPSGLNYLEYDVNPPASSTWDFHWDVTADPDPLVTSALAITNTTAFTQTFTSIITIPVTPAVTPSSLIRGSIGGSVSDANSSGAATLSTASGTALYTALIDGSPVQTLYADPYSVNVVLPDDTSSVPSTNFGIPVFLPGPAALTSIGIQIKFTLTPGDSASFTSVFRVEPVPEPAGLALVGIAAVGMLVRRRKAA